MCTRLGDWSTDGTETCTLAGFAPKADQGAGWCFDGRVPVPRRSSHKAASGSRPVLSFEGLRSAWVMSAGGACIYALLRLRSALRRSSRSGINVAREKAFLVRRAMALYCSACIIDDMVAATLSMCSGRLHSNELHWRHRRPCARRSRAARMHQLAACAGCASTKKEKRAAAPPPPLRNTRSPSRCRVSYRSLPRATPRRRRARRPAFLGAFGRYNGARFAVLRTARARGGARLVAQRSRAPFRQSRARSALGRPGRFPLNPQVLRLRATPPR